MSSGKFIRAKAIVHCNMAQSPPHLGSSGSKTARRIARTGMQESANAL
jgi:hypothetical protein